MLGKTHMAVGVAVGLAVMQPHTIQELIAGTGTLAVSSVISDIDIGTSDSHKDADKIIAMAGLTCVAVAAAEAVLDLGIYDRLMKNSSLMQIVAGSVAFLLLCAFGKEQPHRSFMHSIPALVLLTGCIWMIFPVAVPYFAIGFASHLVIDLLNHRDERLLYPLKWGLSFGVCSSKGVVNRMLFSGGFAVSVGLFAICLLRLGNAFAHHIFS